MNRTPPLPPEIEKLLDRLAAESQQRVQAWLETHLQELQALDADRICVAQLHHMSLRDAGKLDPDPRKFHCPSCRRTEQLALAAIKLWLFSLSIRGLDTPARKPPPNEVI